MLLLLLLDDDAGVDDVRSFFIFFFKTPSGPMCFAWVHGLEWHLGQREVGAEIVLRCCFGCHGSGTGSGVLRVGWFSRLL